MAVGKFGPQFEDREGNLWLGSWTHGLMRLSDGHLASWSMAEGLSSDAARTLFEGDNGTIWVGTTDGLNRISGRDVRWYRRAQPPLAERAHNWVYALTRDSEDGLWVGTQIGLAQWAE